MDWIDHVLVPFIWVRAILADVGTPGEVFVVSLVGYALVLLFMAVVAHVLSRRLARGVRWSARRLARGAALSDVVRLESSSARIESALYWIGTRVIQSSYRSPDRVERIPHEGDERSVSRAMRRLLRSLWLLLRGFLAFLSALPGFLLTAFGLSVLLLAFCTAFPEVIRDSVLAAEVFIAGASWSEASTITAITVGATVVPVAVVITKVVVSEPAVARRSFRRRRNEAALEQLDRAESAIATLAHAVHDQMYEMVHTFKIEKSHAQQWFEWTRRSSREPDRWGLRSGDHLECGRECLDLRSGMAAPRTHESALQSAVVDVEAAWSEGLNENMWILARLMSGRARRGLLSLKWCISDAGEFRMTRLPCLDEWQRRRINWQHDQLAWGDPTDSDKNAGRTVAVRSGDAPDTQWLEEDLLGLVWDLAELRRELSDLAGFAHALSRPHRFERVIGATE